MEGKPPDCVTVPSESTSPSRRPDVSDGVRFRLWLVFVIVLVETAFEVAFVLGRDDYGPGGKALVAALFLLKIWFAWRVRSLSAPAVFGLLLFELSGIIVASGAAFSMGVRALLVGCVIAVFALVGSCLSAFPSPEIR